MKVAVFSTKAYDRQFLESANAEYGHELVFLEPRLNEHTAALASEFPAVCVFVNDQLDRQTLKAITDHGTRFVLFAVQGLIM